MVNEQFATREREIHIPPSEFVDHMDIVHSTSPKENYELQTNDLPGARKGLHYIVNKWKHRQSSIGCPKTI
jgi:hypothetical protein